MEIKFDVRMTQKVLFNFLISHMYHSPSGVFGVVMGIMALAAGAAKVRSDQGSVALIMFLFAAYLLLFMPINLYFNATKQMKLNPAFQEALCYTVDEEGVACSQAGQETAVPWDHIVKVRETKYSLLLYTGKRYCFIFPKESMGDNVQAVASLIRKHMDAKLIKMKV